MQQPQDNFLLLRFIAASMVVLSHSYDILRPDGDFVLRAPMDIGFNLGIIAVCFFFFLSGFLVTGSYDRRRDLFGFAKSRILRIVPAYAVCILLVAFVIGAACTDFSWNSYLTHAQTREYVLTNLTFNNLQSNLPGVFENNPHPKLVNASLWTLPGEVRMYLYVAAFGWVGLLSRRWIANALIIGLGVVGAASPQWLPLLDYPENFLPLAALFAGGALCYVNRSIVPVAGFILCALIAITVLLHGTVGYKAAALATMAYFCLWFAYQTRWYGFNRFGDFSYGIYLWNWPIQQTIVHFVDISEPLAMFAVSYPMILGIAASSWRWIEKPMLRLK